MAQLSFVNNFDALLMKHAFLMLTMAYLQI